MKIHSQSTNTYAFNYIHLFDYFQSLIKTLELL